MPSGNEGDGVLRRMVKRVSSPARDLIGLGSDTQAPESAADVERAELKAMIERKRRNDFVRKRELDMLRRIRREGLTPDQAASLEATSRIDESDARITQAPQAGDLGVKAKIDAIERQMVGAVPLPSRSPPPPAAPLRPGVSGLPTLSTPVDGGATIPVGMVADGFEIVTQPMITADDPLTEASGPGTAGETASTPAAAQPWAPAAVRAAAAAPVQPSRLPAMEVSEVIHDQELDEAVIAFANADFTLCEQALGRLIAPHGARESHIDTWLVMFDLYRATGQQPAFDALAAAFSERFQRSAPQWFSLPRLVAEATHSSLTRRRDAREATQVAWVCPATLDTESVGQLSSQTLQLPQPWVLDWSLLQQVTPDGAGRLHALMRQWAQQPLDMDWLGAERLFAVLQDAAPVGVRDADPAIWLLRLEALRLVNRPDQFDDAAIDYCVTFEVSPPSWEASRCVARTGNAALHTRTAALSAVGGAVTTLQDMADGSGTQPVTTLELMGQLSGDIGATLTSLNTQLGSARLVRISCALLIRADFLAAGDLLNWVLSKQGEARQISFVDVHRLVALMFSAMGVHEHADVHLRQA